MARFSLVAGLMSGTSLDGIDAVLLRVSGRSASTRFRVLSFVERPFPSGLRRMLLRNSIPETSRVDEITRLHMVLGQFYADAVRVAARAARVPLSSVSLIGSHGQTIQHLPSPRRLFGRTVRATLQIGDPSVIAALTGVTTVGDFRTTDMALGGEGAPLIPYFDWLVFRSSSRNRLLLNIGGIANITVLPKGCRASVVTAFDTGPGNMLVDSLMQKFYGRPFDRDGATAARGQVNARLLRRLHSHPYLRRKPPKSTGREVFGEGFLQDILRWGKGMESEDIVATTAYFTATSVQDACRRYVARHITADELIVSGGGARNRFMIKALEDLFSGTRVRNAGTFGVPADAKEAICFAILAYETIAGVPVSIPSVTGAARAAVLGKICPPPAGHPPAPSLRRPRPRR